jgi:hypothetical protein
MCVLCVSRPVVFGCSVVGKVYFADNVVGFYSEVLGCSLDQFTACSCLNFSWFSHSVRAITITASYQTNIHITN